MSSNGDTRGAGFTAAPRARRSAPGPKARITVKACSRLGRWTLGARHDDQRWPLLRTIPPDAHRLEARWRIQWARPGTIVRAAPPRKSQRGRLRC
eukprot:1291542-Pyramimonas_sp.AAC.1